MQFGPLHATACRNVLNARQIGHGVHYPLPIHLQEASRKDLDYHAGDFPVSERIAREVLSLPVYPG